MQQAMNVDIAYLCQSAERMLNGIGMKDGYYDTNPPLSIILYIPVVLLHKFSGFELYNCLYIFGFSCLILSSLLLYRLLKISKWCSEEKIHILIISYIAANMLLTGHEFGQRDHLLLVAALPLFLTQIMMTFKIQVSQPIQWISLIWGAIFILLKPHYGIIPACIFIHRAFTQKRFFSIMCDKDFLVLAGCALLYLGLLLTIFNAFLFEIMPDILSFYVIAPKNNTMIGSAMFIAISVALLIASMKLLKTPEPLLIGLSAIALLCVIPYYLQGHGFLYHSIPVKIMLLVTASLFLYRYALDSMKNSDSAGTRKAVVFVCCIFMLTITNHIAITLNRPSHDEYKTLALTQAIDDCPKEECSFFMFHNTISMIHELGVYTDQPHASRFSAFWFLPYFLHTDWGKDDPDFKEKIDRYINFVVEDIDTYQPYTLVFGKFYINETDQFDLNAEFGSRSPRFAKMMENYVLDKTIIVDRADYMGAYLDLNNNEPIPYDIYKRKSP